MASYFIGQEMSFSAPSRRCISTIPRTASFVASGSCVRSRYESAEHHRKPDGGTSTTWHRGSKLLLDVGQPVYSGPVGKGINAWEFSVIVPARPDLPPTYFINHAGRILGARVDWLYSEYFLQAEVIKQSSPHKPAVATFPIYVRYASTPQPVTDFQPRYQAIEESVRTLHLEPEFADKHLFPTAHENYLSAFHDTRVLVFSHCGASFRHSARS